MNCSIIHMEFADRYIESPDVQRLNVSSQDVHDALWPTFKQLLSPSNISGWKYEQSFRYALATVIDEMDKAEADEAEANILSNKEYQLRLCFYFIMHLYH